MRVTGYVRVSTEEQAVSGAGLEAQRRAILAECKRRGWELVETIEDAGYSAKDLKRPGVQEALRALEAGDAKALVVAKLDRLSRSMLDFAALMATAQKQHWALVALDCAVDTSTPAGEAMAHVLATFGQFERRLIGQRTKEALAVKNAKRYQARRSVHRPAGGRASHRARSCAWRLAARDRRQLERQQGADRLRGKQWYASTVRAVLARTA
jgi:DNA invertase Pin-like site-specific DNA recombinase